MQTKVNGFDAERLAKIKKEIRKDHVTKVLRKEIIELADAFETVLGEFATVEESEQHHEPQPLSYCGAV